MWLDWLAWGPGQMEVHGLALVGYPICPTTQLLFAELGACRWRWYRRDPSLSQSLSSPPLLSSPSQGDVCVGVFVLVGMCVCAQHACTSVRVRVCVSGRERVW